MRPARRYGVGPLRTSSLLGTSRFRKCQFTGMILSRFRRSESDVKGPLTLYQMKKLNKDGLYETMITVNKFVAESLPSERLAKAFDVWWPHLEERLLGIPLLESA